MELHRLLPMKAESEHEAVANAMAVPKRISPLTSMNSRHSCRR